MELFASSVPFLCPTAVFLDAENYYATHVRPVAHKEEPNTSATHWDASAVNPKNCLAWAGAGAHQPPATWRIDGCTSYGTQFFAVLLAGTPHTSSSTQSTCVPYVRRISVHIPDQARQSLALRQSLQTVEAAAYGQGLPAAAVRRLAIAEYVTQALTHWSNRWSTRIPAALLYARLPFGARIVIEHLTPNVLDSKPRLLDGPVARSSVSPDVAGTLLSVAALEALWPGLTPLPPLLHLDTLALLRQVHGNVALVSARGAEPPQLWAFKSNIAVPRYLYHELKTLLSLPPHPHVLPKPSFLVVVDSLTESGSSSSPRSPLVLGMLGTYYPLGHLGHVLEGGIEGHGRAIPWQTKCAWATQLASVLDWLRSTPVRYYAELKPDNIVCTGHHTIRLVDLAQHGNWETFTAPEVYHVENLVRLARRRDDAAVPETARARYAAMAADHMPRRDDGPVDHSILYNNPCRGYFDEWNALSGTGQEAAMVYALGKVLWCIFEGWSHTVNSPAETYAVDCGWEFPVMRQAPLAVQVLVRTCTQGSPDWRRHDAGDANDDLVRIHTKLYPRGKTGQAGRLDDGIADTASALETLVFARDLWTRRLADMEHYVAAKLRWARGQAKDGDATLLGFPLRPKLRDVMAQLLALDEPAAELAL